MAVYTVLDREDVEAFIKPYGIGPLVDYEGVAAGVENTNYFITTDQSDFPSELQTQPLQHYVLTIFESIATDDLTFYCELTTLLNLKGLPVPCPLKNADGVAIQYLHGKPVLLMPKIQGEHPAQPSAIQCQTIAKTLARLHLICLNTPMDHDNHYNLDWLETTVSHLIPQLDPADQALVEDEIKHFKHQVNNHPALPRSIIHSDLFRDNALFDGDELTAIIDFNSAGNGYLLFDLAVIVNDWCSDADGTLNANLAQATLAAYQHVRPFTGDEAALWNDFLRIAAMRFWISRLAMQLQPESSHRPGGLVEQKDPLEYRNILLQRIDKPMPIAE